MRGKTVESARGATSEAKLDRAVRLFEFLARVQQVKSPSPRTVEAYQDVIWFHRLPAHPALVSAHTTTGLDCEAATLVVDRVQRVAPPAIPDSVRPWIDGQLDDPETEPHLRKTRVVEIPAGDLHAESTPASVVESLENHPDVVRGFDQWLPGWRAWAIDDLAARPVRELYSRLFSIHVAVGTNPEELELVCGTACLSWQADGHPGVQRHLLTSAAALDFDDISGRLTVRAAPSPEPLTVELDMLDPGMVRDAPRIQDIRSDAQGFEAHHIDRDEVGVLGQRLVHCLDPNGAYLDRDEPTAPRPEALVSYAPALILRKRSQQGLIQIFETIAGQLRETGEVPEGIMPLVDPNHVPDPGLSSDGQDGGIVEVDDEIFLPLPVNDAQLKIVRRVDHQAQTLVQGPPGTGKTHTAAALISHLVAQGKRVLVTAQTDRALKEVRDKLPESIRPLSVAVVGAARQDMSQLRVAVERIAAEAAEHNGDRAERRITSHLSAIDGLRRRRAALYHDLVEAREAEVRHLDVHGYSGTLAAIAQAHQAGETRFGWISELVTPEPEAPSPLSDAEIAEWRSLLLDGHVHANETDAGQDLLDPSFLVDPVVFADTVARERTARNANAGFAQYATNEAFDALSALDESERGRLAAKLRLLANEGAFLRARYETWITSALTDIQRHKASVWRARRDQITTLLGAATPLVGQLGSIVDVRVALEDSSPLVPLARAVLAHIRTGGKVKAHHGGHPKLGAWAPKVLRQASPLFDAVRVEGVPPTTEAHLEMFLTWVEATRAVDALDRAWPTGTKIPPEDTLAERIQWHVTELELLDRVLRFADALDAHEQALVTFNLPPGNWSEPEGIAVLSHVVQAVAARLALEAASKPIDQLEDHCAQASRWADANACIRALHASVRGRDADSYRTAHGRLHELLGVRQSIARREELGARLADAAPALHAALAADPSDSRWGDQLASFSASWRWAAAGSWVRCREQVDVNSLKTELDLVEKEIRGHVEGLTATRAWTHATSPERINGRARADLQHYAQLVKSLGKGTGKYAAKKRTEIRAAMGQCRSSVPVWILPIYRIAEQLRVSPGMFDVVIVDEASQAGLEATFLQYLAPKIVVIGDDKQVSPSAVGVDQQQLIDLALQYLHEDPYRASWSDPLRSLFDMAKMRYGGLITLVEHRRCVPEIIGFSNRVAYEPDGIRLIPVRQYGADRLEPIKPVFLSEGYTKGTTSKINPVEVEAIVDQVAKCLVDPRYDGLTFGVISLLGPAQAKAIEKALLERIPSEEWSARDLRCGDSADFQGSERDVMFLSMVAAPEPGRRLGALTMDMYVQRYNVAASRAKDQMWVFHSVPLAELGNSEDMRFALLDYCYGVANRLSEASGIKCTPVPEDTRVAPFDSLFEQRVFNRLVDRGYSVIPQYEVEGYRIDLVIVGPGCKLAVECDGDAWHGRDAYEKDIARQRDLERCGWRFFRIPEFRFYVDPAGALAPLWELLDQLDIHPSGWTRTPLTPPVPPTPPSVSSTITGTIVPPLLAPPSESWGDDDEVGDSGQEIEEDGPEPGIEYLRPVETEPARPSGLSMLMEKVVPPPVTNGHHEASPSTTQRRGTLAPYPVFSGRLTPALASTTARLIDDLVAIAAVEGPVVGERLQQAHVRASGGQKVGSQIASTLNRAITAAVRRGLLVEEDPLGDQGVKPKTYRLPNQTLEVCRERGPRELDQIPPAELALVMAEAARLTGWADDDALFRATLKPYGWVRLGPNVVAHLRRIKAIAR